MKILAVDTALGACSAALLDGENVVAAKFVAMQRGHAEALAPMVEAVMAGFTFPALDKLAVTVGPGTFTGQRVGLAFMRALRVATNKPLVGVTSLAAMAEQARAQSKIPAAAAVHDARRGEVYIEIIGAGVELAASVMTFENALAVLRDRGGRLVLAGSAASRMAEAMAPLNPVVTDIFAPDAIWVAHLAAALEPQQNPPRPLYLRAPDAKLPSAKP